MRGEEGPVWREPLIYFPPLLWALNVVASRAAMREMPPEWGSFLRFALALPFFLLFLRRLPRLFPLGETLFLALFGVALFNLVFFSGMRLAPASDASAVAAVYPLSTAFAYSLYFRKPLPRNLLLSLLLSGEGGRGGFLEIFSRSWRLSCGGPTAWAWPWRWPSGPRWRSPRPACSWEASSFPWPSPGPFPRPAGAPGFPSSTPRWVGLS